MKTPSRASHDPVHSRRTFVRNMTLGAAYLGTGAAGGLVAELADATKGGERELGVALMGLGLYSRGELAPALHKTKICRFMGAVTGDHAKGVKWSQKHGFPEK